MGVFISEFRDATRDAEPICVRHAVVARQVALEGDHGGGDASRPIHELRDLLEAWRDARRTVWQTVIKVITTGILAALLVGAVIKLKLMESGQ